MAEYIEIDKTLIPYDFDITMDNKTYTFSVRYNNVADFFSVDISRQGVLLAGGEKLVYGQPLFGTRVTLLNGKYVIIPKTNDFPAVLMFPYDTAQIESRVSYSNLGDSVRLWLRTEADLNG
jgi:hypothetical protein